MKKLLATLGLILALTFSANAQLINININLDRQPSWGRPDMITLNFIISRI